MNGEHLHQLVYGPLVIAFDTHAPRHTTLIGVSHGRNDGQNDIGNIYKPKVLRFQVYQLHFRGVFRAGELAGQKQRTLILSFLQRNTCYCHSLAFDLVSHLDLAIRSFSTHFQFPEVFEELLVTTSDARAGWPHLHKQRSFFTSWMFFSSIWLLSGIFSGLNIKIPI